MAPQRLPNEILIQVVEESLNDKDDTYYLGAPDQKEYETWLWTLCKVNRLFRDVARKKLFENIAVSYSGLRDDVKFLRADHIVRHIRKLHFDLGPTEWEDDLVKGRWKVSWARMFHTPGDTAEEDDAVFRLFQAGVILGDTPKWVHQQFEPSLIRLFRSLRRKGNLKEIAVKLQTGAPSVYREGIYTSFKKVLSTVFLSSLQSLYLDVSQMTHASVLWEPEGKGKELQSNCKKLICNGKSHPNGNPETLRKLESWIKSMEKLEVLTLVTVWCPASYPPPSERLRVLELGCSQHLKELKLVDVDIGDSLSEMFHNIHEDGRTLRVLSLHCCRLVSEVDRWEWVFSACANLVPGLKGFGIGPLGYFDPGICADANLCSPFEEDDDAMDHLRGELLFEGVEDLDEGGCLFRWWYCDGSHEDAGDWLAGD